MVEDIKVGVFERLKHSVQLLALPAEAQLKLLPSFVCKADELASDYETWREVTLRNYGKELSVDQVSSMAQLDEKLEGLTDDGSQHWSDAAVRTSPEWQDVRHLAAGVLRAFGWPAELPPSYAHEYISTDPLRRHRN
jgi:hypothetical protein